MRRLVHFSHGKAAKPIFLLPSGNCHPFPSNPITVDFLLSCRKPSSTHCCRSPFLRLYTTIHMPHPHFPSLCSFFSCLLVVTYIQYAFEDFKVYSIVLYHVYLSPVLVGPYSCRKYMMYVCKVLDSGKKRLLDLISRVTS